MELIEERVRAVTVHESLEAYQLRQLAAQHLGVSTEMVCEHSRGLLVFGEIAALEESCGLRSRVHEEERRVKKLDRDAAEVITLAVVKENVFDVSKRILDLVPSLLIVDVVGHGALVWRVKDDEVHSVLTNSRPLADGERTASKMMDHCTKISNANV